MLESEIVISLVQPAQAVALALRISVCFSREIARGSAAPFEIESTSTATRYRRGTARTVAEIVAASGPEVADASFYRPASSLAEGKILLGGRKAAGVAALFEPVVEARTIRGHIGAASAVKMSVSSILAKAVPSVSPPRLGDGRLGLASILFT